MRLCDPDAWRRSFPVLRLGDQQHAKGSASGGYGFYEFGSKHGAKSVPPKPDRLVADFDTALMQSVFNIAK